MDDYQYFDIKKADYFPWFINKKVEFVHVWCGFGVANIHVCVGFPSDTRLEKCSFDIEY